MKFLKYSFIVSQAIIFSYGISFALNVCPGEVRSVSWSSTGATTCNVSVTSSSFGCSLTNSNCAGGPVGVTAPTSGSCTASMSGTGPGGTDTKSDVLNVVNSSSCCDKGSQVGLRYWKGSSCQQYDDEWCQASPRFYDIIDTASNGGLYGYCACTSPRTYVGGRCTCPTGTNWNGVWGAGATCANPIVNGSCRATHNGCSAGSSINATENASYFYWQCKGTGGGATVLCSELKPCANGAGNPPTCTPIPTVNLTADSIRVSYNTGTTLRWTTANSPTSCTATIGWTGSKAVGGGNQATGNLTVAQTYNLQCFNAGGSSALAQVTVTPCGQATPNWNGTACVPIVYSCTGTPPANTTAFPAPDNTGLGANTAYAYSATDTATKCQYQCSTGFTRSGNRGPLFSFEVS